ncbi:hypothetical protein SKTS_17130 [Sulfurimicrobium lacus]|uniref:histidine kinase n=1 Tax=Sulfurimicrobium lacus TaxID=2715678 RepID=A0A6F8VCJ2_9PROT|nr:ATP-binding protein [Sulfurimicrobium lacus]BCB26827.1 hypothetical protein SKTS_17130 [Sulfurimicrobium lacus]
MIAAFWSRLPLVARLLTTANFALLVAGTAMLFVSARQEARDARDDLKTELAQELETLPATLAEVVVIGDFASLQQDLERYVTRPRVASVQFVDPTGKSLQSSDKPLVAIAPDWFSATLGFQDASGKAKVTVGGHDYGSIFITLSARGLANRSWQRLMDLLGILLLALSVDFIGIWLVLRGGLAPLKRLESGAESIASGNLETRLAIEGSPELRHLIGTFNRMTAATQLAQERLRLANADLTRFAEISAHHLMEPTRRFTSYTQRLRARLAVLPDRLDDEEVRTSLHYLERDAERLRGLVRDIQLYLAAGEARGEVRTEDANAVLATLRQRLKKQLAETGASLEVDALPPAVLDRPRLMDLFAVLLDNALQHGQPADSSVPPQIRISGERDGDLTRFRVSDNGPGIPAEYRERVFEIFERLNIAGGKSGTGIGLSIARRIVESRHGRIWIENLEQGGAMVAFELPDGE